MCDVSNAPLVVVDFRVAVYQIYSEYQFIKANCPPETVKSWLKAAWALKLNRGYTGLPYFPHTVVVVDDSSPYWRNDYLREQGFPEYKGGRPTKTDEWFEVNQAGIDYIHAPNSPLHYLKFERFEADDIASALVRTSPKRLIFLHTIDSDWMGLVKDGCLNANFSLDEAIKEPWVDTTVQWVSMGKWTPRFRNVEGVIAHTLKREKTQIANPTQVWDIKAEKGDKSDNLIKGSPLEVINLLNPPPQYDLLNKPQFKTQIVQVANAGTPNSSLKHIKKAHAWFFNAGHRVPLWGYYDFVPDFLENI